MKLPTPKFAIGDQVFHATTTIINHRLPCPDCLDTKVWKIITPSGHEMETACQRCEAEYHDLPSLNRPRNEPKVSVLKIGSVRIDTHDENPVTYMCVETGVGSGIVYYERDLFSKSCDAMDAAMVKANSLNQLVDADPKSLEQKYFSQFTFSNAKSAKARSEIFAAWSRYHFLRDDIDGIIKDKALDSEGLRKAMVDALDWDGNHRTVENTLIDQLIGRAKVSASLHKDTELQAVLDRLPF